MYIDSFTVAAMIIFVVTVAAFIRYCLVKACGLKSGNREADDSETTCEKHS